MRSAATQLPQNIAIAPGRVVSAGRWAAVLILAAVLLLGGVALLAPLESACGRLTDDAYYYFKVAQNVSHGRGLSFDGFGATNGFHPLWMLLVLPIFAALDSETALRGVMLLSVAIYAASAALCYLGLRRRFDGGSALVGLLLMLSSLAGNASINGLETGILILVVWLVLMFDARGGLLAPEAPAKRDLLLGALLGLLFLARLDSAFIVVAVYGSIVWNARLPAGPWLARCFSRLCWVSLSAAPLAAGYFLWNYVSFGHLSPLSGALKSSFPAPSWRFHALTHPGPQSLFVLLLAVAVAALLTRRMAGHDRLRETGRATRPISMFGALVFGALLHLAYSCVFMNWAVHWWHFALYFPLGVCAVAELVHRLSVAGRLAPRTRQAAVGVLLVLAGLSWLADALARRDHHTQWFAAAEWAQRNLPPDAVVAVADAGLFGYFSQRPTVNLDGVINSYEFQDVLRQQRLEEYFQQVGVTHVADYQGRYDDSGSFRVRVPARLARGPGHVIVLNERSQVYASPPYWSSIFNTRGKPYQFMIWELRGGEVRPAEPKDR